MKEYTLNRLPGFDTDGYVAYGRLLEEEEGATPVPFVMVPIEVFDGPFGHAEQLNVQLSR